MTSLVGVLLIVSQIAIVTSVRRIELNGENCNEHQFKKTEIAPEEKIELVWDNDMDDKCSLSMNVKKKDVMDIYKICMRVEVFRVACDITLTYYQDGSIEEYVKGCKDSLTLWCGDQDRTVYLIVNTKTHILDALLPDLLKGDSNIKLTMYTEKVYSVEDSKQIAVYIGYAAAAVAGLGLVIILVGCVVYRVRRKRRRSQRARPDDFATQTMVPSSQGQCDVNRDFSRGLVAPTAPPGIQVEVEPDTTEDPDLTDLPPPSYDEVMAMEEDDEPDSK